MKCNTCKKDYNYFTELHPKPRIDNSEIYYSVFNPRKRDKELICWKCLGWDKP